MRKKGIKLFLALILSILIYAISVSAGPWTLAGTVMNSSYTAVGQVNVSIATFSPPATTVYLNSTLTADDGSFHLTCTNDTQTAMFKIRVLARKNSSNTYGPTGNLSEIGPFLPALPIFVLNSSMFNGSTIYTEPAATIEINATFSNGSRSDFGYMLIDDVFGEEVEMRITTFVTESKETLYVPRNRNYTLLLMKSPDALTAKGVTDYTVESPIPPIPFAINNITSYADTDYIIRRTYNISFTPQSVYGYIFIAGNNTYDRMINFTKATVKLSTAGFVPPGATMNFGTVNITSKNTTIANIDMPDGAIGYYSLPVLGASTGIDHMIQFYGKNQTFCDESAGGNCYFGAIANFTVTTSNITKNITLYPLLGSYDATAGTKHKKFYVYDGSNPSNPYLNDIMAEVKLKNSSKFGTFRFMVESISSSYFSMFMPSDVASATVKIFTQKSAPSEKPIPTNNSAVNFTIKSTNMEMPVPGGGRVAMDNNHLTFRILRYNSSCNTPFANFDGCQIGSMQNGGFNPLSLLMGGKINLKININGSDSSLLFIGVDKFASGPPTNSVIGNQSTSSNSSGSTLGETWQIGTVSPDFYEKVYVTIPYNNSVDETVGINITLDTLYDNDWSEIWNTTANPSATNIPDDYSDFNTTWFNKTKGGMPCTNSSTASFNCYINYSGNYLILDIPHFSNTGATIGGSRSVASSSVTLTSSGNAEELASIIMVEKKKNWYSIQQGEPVFMEITDENFEIRRIDIAVKDTAMSPKLTVARLSAKPAIVIEPPNTAYRYIEIKQENLPEAKLEEVKINFRVERSWLKNNSYDESTIKLSRYKDGWKELPTTKLGAVDGHIYYEAITPGFSYFAITAGKAKTPAEKPAEEEETTGEATPQAPAEEIAEEATEKTKSKTWIWLAAAITLIIIAACVVWLVKRIHKKK